MRTPYLRDAKQAISDSLMCLTARDRNKFFFSILFVCFLALLDLFGVAAIAGIAAVGSSAVRGQEIPPTIENLARTVGLENLSVVQIASILGLASALLLSAKTILSLRLNRKILLFLANRENEFVSDLVSGIFRLPYLKLSQKTSAEYINVITHSAGSLVSGSLGYFSFILIDLSVLITMLTILFIADPLTSLFTICYFGSLILVSTFVVRKRAKDLSVRTIKNDIEVFDVITDAINGYKEAKATDTIQDFVTKIKANRSQLPKIAVEQMQLTLIPKFFIEIGLIVGVIAVSGLQFLRNDATNSITVLAVFFVASARITPSLLRVQNSFLLLIQARTASQPILETLQTIKSFEKKSSEKENTQRVAIEGFEILAKDLCLIYPGKSYPAVNNVTLRIPENTSLGIIGRSGSGKTSLVDLILGLHEPSSGTVKVGGVKSHDIASNHSGLFAYVPQMVYIKNASILENVAFGIPFDEISVADVWLALERASLKEFVSSLDEGLDFKLGERGIRLSGGQRQRINIARALYHKPKILILDEATSSLDIETEVEINNLIGSLTDITRIMIAHRLTSLSKVDKIVVLENGRLIQFDSYDNLKSSKGRFQELNNLYFDL